MTALTDRRADFYRRLCGVTEILDPYHAEGHPDLPQYRRYMGPRYAPRGYPIPLSVFRGEAVALWTVVAVLRPRLVLDLYTGTGLTAATMEDALHGTPARVITCDHFGEGGTGEDGAASAARVFGHFGTRPVQLRSTTAVRDALARQPSPPDFAVLDGAGGWEDVVDFGTLRAWAIHDRIDCREPHAVQLPGGSYLWFVTADPILAAVFRGLVDEVGRWLAAQQAAWTAS